MAAVTAPPDPAALPGVGVISIAPSPDAAAPGGGVDTDGWKAIKFQSRWKRSAKSKGVQLGMVEFRNMNGDIVIPVKVEPSNEGTYDDDVDSSTFGRWLDDDEGTITYVFSDADAVQGADRNVVAFRLMTGENDEGKDPVKWIVEGSRDESSWELVHEQGRRYPMPRERNSKTRWFKIGAAGMEEWQLNKWLEDSGILDLMANVLCPQDDIEFDPNRRSYNAGRVKILKEQDYTDLLENDLFKKEAAKVLTEATNLLASYDEVVGEDWNSKYETDINLIQYKFGDLDTFFGGLEGLVDLPNPKILEGMFEDHCMGEIKDTRLEPETLTEKGVDGIERPNTRGPDVVREWKTGNYGITTTSMSEWGFVVHAEWGQEEALKKLKYFATGDGKDERIELLDKLDSDWSLVRKPGEKKVEPPVCDTWAVFEKFYVSTTNDFTRNFDATGRPAAPLWPLETLGTDEFLNSQKHTRRPRPLESFREAWRMVNVLLQKAADEQQEEEEDPDAWLKATSEGEQLQIAELIGARLYTGPLFEKYNGRLRFYSKNPFLVAQAKRLCRRNTYTTTLHVINSSLIKLGKVLPARKVYRGLKGGKLPDTFRRPNKYNVKGGIEFGFTSTTTDRNVAIQYTQAVGAKARMIFELQLGMVDKGADLGWVSQYPHEKEICLSPLAGMEVTSTSIEGDVLVITLRLNMNMMALTIEQVIRKRFKLLRELTVNTRKEIAQYLRIWEKQSVRLFERGLVKYPDLAKECDEHFERNITRGKKDKEYYNIDVNLRDGLVNTVEQRIWVVGAKAIEDCNCALKLVEVPFDIQFDSGDGAKKTMCTCPLLPMGEKPPEDLERDKDGNEYTPEQVEGMAEEVAYWKKRGETKHIMVKTIVKRESDTKECDRCEQRIEKGTLYGHCSACKVSFCISCANQISCWHVVNDLPPGCDPEEEGNEDAPTDNKEGGMKIKDYSPPLRVWTHENLDRMNADPDAKATLQSLLLARFLSCQPDKLEEEGNLRYLLMYMMSHSSMWGSENAVITHITTKEKVREGTFSNGILWPDFQKLDFTVKARKLEQDRLRRGMYTPLTMLKLGFPIPEVYENARRGGVRYRNPFRGPTINEEDGTVIPGGSVVCHVMWQEWDKKTMQYKPDSKYVADEVYSVDDTFCFLKDSGAAIYLSTGNNRFKSETSGFLEQWEVNNCDKFRSELPKDDPKQNMEESDEEADEEAPAS